MVNRPSYAAQDFVISDGFLSFDGFGVSVCSPFFFFLPFFCASAGIATNRHKIKSNRLDRVMVGFISFRIVTPKLTNEHRENFPTLFKSMDG